MQRLLVLVVLFIAFFLALKLSVQTDGAFDSAILAAIGFVILASYTAAEVGSVFTLPRVSGYITAGVLLGPSVFDLLSARVVEEMTMFNTLALGLIATGAGLELETGGLKKLWRTLTVTVLGKIGLAGGLVFGSFVAIQHFFSPLHLESTGQILSVGLVLATLSVGTSPAIVLAVINEMGAKGRVADLALGAAVIKDFVLVVLLAIAVAVSGGWLGVESSGEHGGVVGLVATELLGSIAVGAIVGLTIIGYVRFIGAEMLLFVAALILAVSEISNVLHLDRLLVFIVSGFVVRNFSRVWEEVLHGVETVALPVFVVFFTIAGAQIDLVKTWAMLPVAAALCAARAGGLFGATKLGAWVSGDDADTARRTFMAYLPQAGVTLGLLSIAAAKLPMVAEEMQALGVAMVAINLMIGPVTLRKGLQEKAEELPAPEIEEEPGEEEGGERLSVMRPSVVIRAEELDFGDDTLKDLGTALERDLLSAIETTVRDHLVAHGQALSLELSTVLEGEEEHTILQRLHRWGREERARDVVQRAASAARNLFDVCEQRLSELNAEVTVSVQDELYRTVVGDGRRVRFRKWKGRMLARLTRKTRMRRIPARLAARHALTPRMAQLSVQLLGAMCRTHARILSELRRTANGDLGLGELADAVTEHLDALPRDFRTDAQVAVGQGVLELSELMQDIDSPVRPIGTLRFSNVEPEARRYIEALEGTPEEWARVLSAAEGGLALATALSRAGHAAEAALEREVLMPLAEASEALEPAVAAAKAQLNEALVATRDEALADVDLKSHLTAFEKLREQREREGPVSASSFRAAAALHAANVEVRQLVDSLPEQVRVPAHRDEPGQTQDPAAVESRVVSLRGEARRMLIIELMPTVDLEGGRAAGSVQDLEARRAEAIEMSESALEALFAGELGRKELEETLERALGHLQQGEQTARTQLISAHDTIASQLSDALSHLSDLTVRGGREALSFATTGIAPLHRVREALQHGWARVRERAGRVRSQWSALMGAELTQHLKSELRTARDLREFVATRETALPVIYGRLFRLEPLRDLRLAAGREVELAMLLDAERKWLKGGGSGALIMGDAGSGRTSLLNLAQTEFNAARLIRPEPLGVPRDLGLTRALAYELRRRPTRKDVAAGLCTHRTVVVLDDLGHWFEPGAAGLTELRGFLDLVVRTHNEVFWAVTASSHWLELVEDAVPVSDVFGTVIELPPLDLHALRRLIETRHVLSGMELTHGQTILSRLLGRVREDSAAEIDFRLLHSVTGGNIQAALAAWSRAVSVEGDAVRVYGHRLLLERLPTLENLEVPVLAVLMQLLRFGPQDPRRLADSLGLSRREVARQLRLLENCGLLRKTGKQAFTLEPEHRHRLVPRLPLSAERRS